MTRSLNMRSPKLRSAVLAACAATLPLFAGCAPGSGGGGGSGPTGLYIDQMPEITPVVTPDNDPIYWGAAPNIDPHYGGTLYAGTNKEVPDPRPPLDNDGNQRLRMWMADPNDGRTDRPAVIWIHGGGFAFGADAMHGLAVGVGADYAKRGYVGFSLEYRMNTTLVPSGNSSPALCQWVQDNENPNDPTWLAHFETCKNNVQAATRDALAAVRYLRANAATYGIDPDRIAVAGFSAGAVTAMGTAYRSDDVGTVSYFTGDTPTSTNSKPQAVLAASGCLSPAYVDGSTPEIGAGDVPTSGIASRFDQALDYSCAAHTVQDARAQSLVAELTSYCSTNLHANTLYNANKSATDYQWTTFLSRWLNLRNDVRDPSADGFCAN